MSLRERLFGSTSSESDSGVIDTSGSSGRTESGTEVVIDEDARRKPTAGQRLANADRSDVRAAAGRARSGLAQDIRKAKRATRAQARAAVTRAKNVDTSKAVDALAGDPAATPRPRSMADEDPRAAVDRAGRTAEMSAPVDASLTPLGGGLADLQFFAGGAPAGEDGLEEFVTGRPRDAPDMGPSLVDLAVGVGASGGGSRARGEDTSESDDPLVVDDPLGVTSGYGGDR